MRAFLEEAEGSTWKRDCMTGLDRYVARSFNMELGVENDIVIFGAANLESVVPRSKCSKMMGRGETPIQAYFDSEEKILEGRVIQ